MSTVYENAKAKLAELMMDKPGFEQSEKHNDYCSTITYYHSDSRQALVIKYVPVPDETAPMFEGTSVIAQIVRENAECLNVDGDGFNMTLSSGNSEVVVPLLTQCNSECKKLSHIYVLPQEDLHVYELIFNRMIAAMCNGIA